MSTCGLSRRRRVGRLAERQEGEERAEELHEETVVRALASVDESTLHAVDVDGGQLLAIRVDGSSLGQGKEQAWSEYLKVAN